MTWDRRVFLYSYHNLWMIRPSINLVLTLTIQRKLSNLTQAQHKTGVNGYELPPEKAQAIVFTRCSVSNPFTLYFGDVALTLMNVHIKLNS